MTWIGDVTAAPPLEPLVVFSTTTARTSATLWRGFSDARPNPRIVCPLRYVLSFVVSGKLPPFNEVLAAAAFPWPVEVAAASLTDDWPVGQIAKIADASSAPVEPFGSPPPTRT
jgi:hypothetical protein